MDKWQTKSTNQIYKHYSCLNHENRYPQKEKATVATNATPSSIRSSLSTTGYGIMAY